MPSSRREDGERFTLRTKRDDQRKLTALMSKLVSATTSSSVKLVPSIVFRLRIWSMKIFAPSSDFGWVELLFISFNCARLFTNYGWDSLSDSINLENVRWTVFSYLIQMTIDQSIQITLFPIRRCQYWQISKPMMESKHLFNHQVMEFLKTFNN